MSETVKCSAIHDKCAYSVKMRNGVYVCDFIGVEKHRRGCPPENCDKFKPKIIGDNSRSRIKL